MLGKGALLGDGSESVPSLRFENDVDTGLYRVGADQLGLSVGGSQVALLDSAGVHPVAGPVFDVVARGATGDGSTDDTTAIQNAIDAAETAGGGIVLLPAGTYVVSTVLSVAAGVALVGAGTAVTQAAAATVIAPTSGVSAVTLAGDGASVEGVFLVGAVSGTSDGVVVAGSRARVSKVTISGFGRYGISADSSGGTNCNLLRADSVRITGCGSHGVYLTGADSNAGLFFLVDIVSVTGRGIYNESARNRFVSCHLSTNTAGAVYDDGNSNVYQVYVESGTGASVELGSTSSFAVYEALNYAAATTVTASAGVLADSTIIQNNGTRRHVKIHDPSGPGSGQTWEFRSGIINTGWLDIANGNGRAIDIDTTISRVAFHCAIAPSADNGEDLGRSSARWKDLYLAGDVHHDGSNVGFFGATPVVQQTAPAALTDSTGGTTDGTLAAISGSGADAAINDNFAELAEDIAAIRTALVNLGLIA